MPDPERPERGPEPKSCPCTEIKPGKTEPEYDPACPYHGTKSTFESFAAHFPKDLCGKTAPTVDGVKGGGCVLKKHGKDVKHSWER